MKAGELPSRLRELQFGSAFDKPLPPGVIPASVTHISFSGEHRSAFDQPLTAGSIPEGVVHLNLGDAFNQPLTRGVLPSSLRTLVLGSQFSQQLEIGSLPDGLEALSLCVPCAFQLPTQPGLIPASVRVVHFCETSFRSGLPSDPSARAELLTREVERVRQALVHVVSPSTLFVKWATVAGFYGPFHARRCEIGPSVV